MGLAKPDAAAYALTCERLGISPHEVLFLDDLEDNVVGARAAGWLAVLHRDTAESIAEMEAVITAEDAG